MPGLHTLLILSVISLGISATPGPNMAYLMSRSMAQGRTAGFISLAGTNAGLIVVMLVSVAGLSSLLTAMPHLWEGIRLLGACGLLWLAWGYLGPSEGTHALAGSGGEAGHDSAARLFGLGFVTSALNPKVVAFYVAGLPHLIDPAHGPAATQGIVLGLTHIGINTGCDSAIVLGAERFARLLRRRPNLAGVQQRAVGVAMALMAVALAVDALT